MTGAHVRMAVSHHCYQNGRVQPSKMKLLYMIMWITFLISNNFVSAMETDTLAPTNETETSEISEALQTALECTSGIKTFDGFRHKKKYRVGVHAIRGFEAAISEYNKTYGEYLSMTAGHRFNPPIQFEMVPLTFEGIFDAAENEDLDFFYANPSIFSCVATEVGAQPLATIISRLKVRGRTFNLDVFGGVIAAHRDNDEINSIEDLKDKIIGAGSISMVMAAQLQFYEMEMAGLSYVMDPKQVVFTGNQFDVVNGILDGEFDVGFVRTDQIERTKDSDGNPIDPELFKIIEPKIYILDDGDLFPFLHSTPIYPEWPLASLTHVPQDVTKEVQNALLAVQEHAEVGRLYEECLEEFDEAHCDSQNFPKDFDPSARCDTTKEIALLAREASIVGKLAGFRTTRSYAELRSMQETAGFISKNERGKWKCTRSSSLYDEIKCPEGHFKRSRKAFEEGCNQAGLPCKEGYDCYCKPCVKAYEVDVYQYFYGDEDNRLVDDYLGHLQSGCDKMSVCGTVEQTKTLTFRAYDNMERPECTIVAEAHYGEKSKNIEVVRIPNTFAYEFNVSTDIVGYDIIEIFADGVQIKESPLLMQVVDRDCASEYRGEGRVPNHVGTCVCRNSAMEIGGKCISSALVFSIIAVILFIIAAQMGYAYLIHKKRQADSLWLVNVDELHFNEPVDIIGQGSFGVVLLAEYRGTKVAVKRVLPPRDQRKGSAGGSDCKTTSSMDGNLEEAFHDDIDLEAQSIEDSKELHDSGAFDTGTFRSWSLNFGRANTRLAKLFPWLFENDEMEFGNTNVLISRSFGSTSSMAQYCGCFDKHSQQKKDFIVEMRLLSRLRHPCITTVMGAVISPTVDPMLVMEYMDYGSLHDLLGNETMYTGGEVILQIVRDIAQGLRYLHASKPPILHGDLKAKNILVDSRFRAKVGDFGLSTKKSNGIHGTPYWMAPEYLRRKSEYTSQCDMYSLGMVLYEIYARKNPYEGENPRRVLRKVCHPRINKRPDVPATCPSKMADIMKKCWSPDPFFRPTAKDLDLLFMDMNMQDVEPLTIEQQGAKANKRAERTTKEVLYDVFPKHIADALNAGKKVEPESHDMVTVVFSDIVGFTTISRETSPLKVSNMLDRLYLAFDSLARKHEIFKVETIGDAYMGVTNLNESQKDDHTKRIAEFGMDLVEAAGKIAVDEENPDKGFINVRVGFHSGPVVSNVIGSLNPRYGLFGDTVNTASRMETNSSANRILCSERAATLLKKQATNIPVTKRGKIGVKGKGNMVTYWVGVCDEKDIVVEPNKSVEKRVVFDLNEKASPESESKSNTTRCEEISAQETDIELECSEVKVDNKSFTSKKKETECENNTTRCDENVAQEKENEEECPEVKVDNNASTADETNQHSSSLHATYLEMQDAKAEIASSASGDIDHRISSLHARYPEKQEIGEVKTDGLIDWIVEILSDHIKKIVAVRKASMTPARDKPSPNDKIIHTTLKNAVCLDEVTNKISMPEFNSLAAAAIGQHSSIEINPSIKKELKEFVILIASGYRSNHFHNFTHSCHVTVSLHKLLQPILTPVYTREQLHLEESNYDENDAAQLHGISYGISSDPMALFALVFSSLIHDVDHRGVSNMQLRKEEPILASRYRNKSIAEQNSFDIAWEILMFDQFAELRRFIFGSQEELLRFRQLVINIVMATDIFDKEFNEMRKQRWQRAFSSQNESTKDDKELNDLRATIILEQIIQAADVSHTMQHWCVYQKWNQQLFREMFTAYRKGRLGSNPANFWYQGELGFFDSYIIPMAKRLDECNMLGTNRSEFVDYAVANRGKWALSGQDLVKEMVENLQQKGVDGEAEEETEEVPSLI